MTGQDKFPNWFLWLWENFLVIVIVGAVIAMILGSGFYFLDSRLSDIEDRLNYAPPKSYEPPNLERYSAAGVTQDQLSMRRQVYVPVYSHIYYQGGSAYSLETTVSIRNIDTNEPIFLEAVEYYDTDGQLAKTHVDQLIKLNPLQTIEFLIVGKDSSGGSGANFLVRWGATSEVDKPMIEAVMVGTSGTQGISFARPGIEISADVPIVK